MNVLNATELYTLKLLILLSELHINQRKRKKKIYFEQSLMYIVMWIKRGWGKQRATTIIFKKLKEAKFKGIKKYMVTMI